MLRVDLSSPLVTIEDVIRLRDERSRVSDLIDELQEQYNTIDAKIEAISLWLSPDLKEHIFGEHGDDDEGGQDEASASRWERVIVPLLKEKGHGLNSAMIRTLVKDQPIEAEVGFQGRTLYRALQKLCLNKTLVREEDFYMLPGQGKPVDVDGLSMSVVLRNGIVDLFNKTPGSYSVDDIRQALAGTKAGDIALDRPTSFYNALSRLASDKKLVRDGRVYRLPSDANTSAEEPASSEAGDEGVFS